MRLLLATLTAVLAFASPAFAGSVTNVTLDNTSPSAAAGARTIYRVGFTATTGLSGGNTITIPAPDGTTFPNFGAEITRGATTLGGCSHNALTITCTLNSSASI